MRVDNFFFIKVKGFGLVIFLLRFFFDVCNTTNKNYLPKCIKEKFN